MIKCDLFILQRSSALQHLQLLSASLCAVICFPFYTLTLTFFKTLLASLPLLCLDLFVKRSVSSHFSCCSRCLRAEKNKSKWPELLNWSSVSYCYAAPQSCWTSRLLSVWSIVSCWVWGCLHRRTRMLILDVNSSLTPNTPSHHLELYSSGHQKEPELCSHFTFDCNSPKPNINLSLQAVIGNVWSFLLLSLSMWTSGWNIMNISGETVWDESSYPSFLDPTYLHFFVMGGFFLQNK